ncbi:helix-turn-helix domain-containing protein [Metabacillus idriensis]|uniref:helix-turn-helix domain-containing protein n=1 Tax=Metabacillus idriensis TaxID=324768 RepID=UPI0017494CE6|nr:AraC family transcriptional regulator [Metabacillus idriensis]
MKNKFYWKLFICMMGVIFAYTAAVTFVYYLKNHEFSSYEREQSQKELLKQTKENIDNRLQVALSGINQLRSTEAFQNFSENQNEQLKYYYVSELHKELQKNSNAFSQFEYKLGVMKSDDDLIVTPDMTIKKARYFHQLGLSKKENEQAAKYLAGKKNSFSQYNMYTLASEDKSNPYVTLLKKEKISSGNNVVFFLSFHKRNFFPDLTDIENTGFAITSGNRITSHHSLLPSLSVHDVLTKHVLQEAFEKSANSETDTQLTSGEYTIKTMNSEVLKDWNYLYFSSKKEFGLSFWEMLAESLPVYVLFLLSGFLITLVIVNYTYRPVKKVLDHLREGQESVGEDEFSFIYSVTEKMKTVNQTLRSTIETNQLPLKNKFMKDLLLGLVENDQISIKLEQFDLKALKEGRVILFEFTHYKEWGESLSREGILTLKIQLLNYLKKHLELSNFYELIEMESEKLAVLTSEVQLEKIREWLNKFKASLDEGLQSTMFIAISEVVQSPAEFERGYKQVRSLLEYRYTIERKNIVTFEDVEEFEQSSYYFPLETEKDLIDLSLRGKKEKALAILKNVLQDNLYNRQLDEAALNRFVFAISASYNRILSQVNQSDRNNFNQEENLYEKLEIIRGKRKLEDTISRLFELLLTKIQAKTEQTDLSVADQLMNFIHMNFQKDLSLTDLAEHFNLSSSYVSTIFKEKTGENFKEYLNMYRIKVAKEILANSDVKISELATMVGFNNVNTFIRIFKKYVGLSPGQYEKTS